MNPLLPPGLFLLTLTSTTYVGAISAGKDPTSYDSLSEAMGAMGAGLSFSIPLMAILLAHEFGHYIAARIHRVPASLPLFIPIPIWPFGTMGAVILMPDRIARRDALLDIGAAGPLAGMAVALPVLAYGIVESRVGPIIADQGYYQEGHSLLYAGMLLMLKGPFPAGQDIYLSATAFAGWVGLLITMINLMPISQLDGGHVAYALRGPRHLDTSRRLRMLLLPLALCVSAAYGLPALMRGAQGDALWPQVMAGTPWLVWLVMLTILSRMSQDEHPPTDDDSLSPGRKWVARGTLALFILLFMPSALRWVVP